MMCVAPPYNLICTGAVTQYTTAVLQCPAGQVCTTVALYILNWIFSHYKCRLSLAFHTLVSSLFPHIHHSM